MPWAGFLAKLALIIVLARRLGQKRAMMLGVACTALSTAALFWARSVPTALIYRLLAGFGTALYGVARHAYVAGAVGSGSRGRAISLFGGMMRIGRFVGPMAGGVMAGHDPGAAGRADGAGDVELGEEGALGR